jgi:hypothetical protein
VGEPEAEYAARLIQGSQILEGAGLDEQGRAALVRVAEGILLGDAGVTFVNIKPGDAVTVRVPGEWERSGVAVEADVWGSDEPLVRVRWGIGTPGGERETLIPARYVFLTRTGGA